ncbi:MAG: nucleotidyltransferase domain-containing protein [Armatimonadota bacterium]
MRTDLYPFEAALCNLLVVDERETPSIPSDAWPAILHLAHREGVTPLVHAAIGGAATRRRMPGGSGEDVPRSVRELLEQSYRYAGNAAEEAYVHLSEVLQALRAAGVAAVLLKGTALARFAYRDAALRPFSDLDLLIRPNDVEAAHQALLVTGYMIAGGAPTPVDLAWRHARGYFDPRRRRMTVDLHWRYAGYPLLFERAGPGVFARARPVEVNGQQALIPAPDDMLLALGIHFARDLWHGKPRLRYLRDAAEVARGHPDAWERLTDTARETPRARSSLYVTLAAAKELLGAPVPTEALHQLRPNWGWITDRLTARIRSNVMRQDRPVDAFAQIALLQWLDAPSMVAYARWLSGLVFVPRELAASRRRWLRGFWARRPSGVDPGG